MLYAYVPSPSSKERKQIRLDCIEKLLENTKNDFKLYEDLMDLSDGRCPCELISKRLNDIVVYNENLRNKNFDMKPNKFKKEPIDAILFKYSINWKKSLNKKSVNVGAGKKSVPRVEQINNDIVKVDAERILPTTTLSTLCGYTVNRCQHVYVMETRQLRAGDEAVSFVKYCKICGCGCAK